MSVDFVGSRTQLELLEVLDGGWIEEPTNENVLFAFEPRVVMAAMHTTTMRANITAYSTAVGPSSFLTKLTSALVNVFMVRPFPETGVGWPNMSAELRTRINGWQ